LDSFMFVDMGIAERISLRHFSGKYRVAEVHYAACPSGGRYLNQNCWEVGSQANSWERILPEESVSMRAWTRKPGLTS